MNFSLYLMTTNIFLANSVLIISEILRIIIMESFSNLVETSLLNHFLFVLF